MKQSTNRNTICRIRRTSRQNHPPSRNSLLRSMAPAENLSLRSQNLDSELRKWRNRVPLSSKRVYNSGSARKEYLLSCSSEILRSTTCWVVTLSTASLVFAYKKVNSIGKRSWWTYPNATRSPRLSPEDPRPRTKYFTGRNLRIRDVYSLCRRFSLEDHISAELLCETVGER